jgi:hypothetical protein
MRYILVFSVLMATSSALAEDPNDASPVSMYRTMNYQRMTGEELLQMHHVLDEWCRGAPGGSALSDAACDERNRLDSALHAKGYCFVGAGATSRWEKGPASRWHRRGERFVDFGN